MRNYGFVLRVHNGPAMNSENVSFTTRRGAMTVATGRVQLTARPWPTTREAERELQPVVTSELILAYTGGVDNRSEIARQLGKPQLATAG